MPSLIVTLTIIFCMLAIIIPCIISMRILLAKKPIPKRTPEEMQAHADTVDDFGPQPGDQK